jgi:hypothetical protein
VANTLRFGGFGIYPMVAGLLVVAAAATLGGMAVWKSGSLPRCSGVLLAAGLVL